MNAQQTLEQASPPRPPLPADVQARLLAFGQLLIKVEQGHQNLGDRDEGAGDHPPPARLPVVLPQLEGFTRLVDVGSGGGLPGVVHLPARPAGGLGRDGGAEEATLPEPGEDRTQAAQLPGFTRIENWRPAYAPDAPGRGSSRAPSPTWPTS